MSNFVIGPGLVPDFEPPFTDALIDDVFMEFTVPAVLYADWLESRDPRDMTVVGTSGRVEINLLVAVHCAENWKGENCELKCEPSDYDNCTQGKNLKTNVAKQTC